MGRHVKDGSNQPIDAMKETMRRWDNINNVMRREVQEFQWGDDFL
jgi:hypothetical protein